MCQVCGFTYDSEKGDVDLGIMPDTPFKKLPEDFVCPWCGSQKSIFKSMSEM